MESKSLLVEADFGQIETVNAISEAVRSLNDDSWRIIRETTARQHLTDVAKLGLNPDSGLNTAIPRFERALGIGGLSKEQISAFLSSHTQSDGTHLKVLWHVVPNANSRGRRVCELFEAAGAKNVSVSVLNDNGSREE
jgi:hypothetical protein